MASFVIRQAGRPDRRFEIPRRDTVIGRGDGCDLVLPNVSVSRKHVRIRCVGLEYQVELLSTSSQLLVNGNVVTEKILATGDELLVGKFTLVFYGDSLSLSEQLLSGISIGDLPTYQVQQMDVNDSTFTLSPSQVKRMREMIRRQRAAVVVSQADPGQRWKPEDQILNFGKKQTVPVGGWLAAGTAATLEWVGSGHVLKKAGLAKVTVKGTVISERML